jgi:hypothetical protein
MGEDDDWEEVHPALWELVTECIGLVKDARAYLKERGDRERNPFVWLHGVHGTQFQPDWAQAKCPHGSTDEDTGGVYCRLCGKRLSGALASP